MNAGWSREEQDPFGVVFAQEGVPVARWSASPILHVCAIMESVGRGLPRVITDLPTIAATWPNFPLLHRAAPSAD